MASSLRRRSERLKWAVAALTILAFCAACTGAPPDRGSAGAEPERVAIKTGTWRAGEQASFAAIEGTVTKTAGGCVVLQKSGAQTGPEIVWPAGWYATDAGDQIAVHRADGTVAVSSGEQVLGAGSALDDPGCAGQGTVALNDDLR